MVNYSALAQIAFRQVGDDIVVSLNKPLLGVQVRNEVRIPAQGKQLLVRSLLLDITLVELDTVLFGKMRRNRARRARSPMIQNRLVHLLHLTLRRLKGSGPAASNAAAAYPKRFEKPQGKRLIPWTIRDHRCSATCDREGRSPVRGPSLAQERPLHKPLRRRPHHARQARTQVRML